MPKPWTEEETYFLQDNWGRVSMPTIAKRLGRSLNAVKMRARKIGLRDFMHSGANMTFNQFLKEAGIKYSSYTKNRLKANGFPIHRQKIINRSVDTVNIDEFWKWAENHKEMINFSGIEKNAFGKEPAWVDKARKASYADVSKKKKRRWTKAEDARLEMLLERNIYTYKELCKELGRSEGAIKRRIWDLALPYRPIKREVKKWSNEEIETLLKMKAEGYGWEKIGEALGRSGISVRGKLELLYNPDYQKNRRNRVFFPSTENNDEKKHGRLPNEKWQSAANSQKAEEFLKER